MTSITHVDERLTRLRLAWLTENPFTDFVPDRLNPPPRTLAPAADNDARAQIDAKLNEADGEHHTTYKQRRAIESQVADYLEKNADEFAAFRDLLAAPAKLRACRRSGHWGERHEAGKRKLIMGWDFKCGCARLCPDESRTEQRRLVRRYKPAIKAWVQKLPFARRVQKGVVTWPNIAPGQLAAFKRRMFVEWSAMLREDFPQVRGALVSQEDPLSAERDDWNLHLNIVVLVEGRFDWIRLIERWTERTRGLFPGSEAEHFQIKMRELPRFDESELDDALREVIKYAVKHQDMAELDPARFVEWWAAGKRFRRTRSYGKDTLFGIGDPEHVPAEIVWHGRVWWDYLAGGYAVERSPRPVFLTQGDNSRRKTPHVGGCGPPGATYRAVRDGGITTPGRICL